MSARVEVLPWDRQPREGEEAYAAFLSYRDLGPGRTHEATRLLLGKRPGYLKPIERWSALRDWRRRSCAWDGHLQAERDEVAREEAAKWERRRLQALEDGWQLCRQTDMAGLQRWTKDHWRSLKGPLGFTRKTPPHATTISRALAKFSLEQFRDVFARWVMTRPHATEAVTVAVDGKTSKQGHDAGGEPVHMLNVFAHELDLCLAQFPVTGGKPTEPQALRHALGELLEHYPCIRLFTADALFTQRPLARAILAADRDFLFAVKDNQPALLEAVLTSFHDAAGREPDAKSVEKKGMSCTPGGSGSWKATRSTTPERRPISPASR